MFFPRTWHDTLKRAKEQYREAQQARDAMVFEDMACVGHLAPRSPRPGSSRASRVSSLAHSHSGSIDLNETSPAATQHHPSIDMSDVRASSASSEDSVALPAPEIQRSRSLEGGGCGAVSPRPDRRPGIPKTPNTLSVTPPYATGQSLPNLTVESSNSLRVPGSSGSNPKALSPGHSSPACLVSSACLSVACAAPSLSCPAKGALNPHCPPRHPLYPAPGSLSLSSSLPHPAAIPRHPLPPAAVPRPSTLVFGKAHPLAAACHGCLHIPSTWFHWTMLCCALSVFSPWDKENQSYDFF